MHRPRNPTHWRHPNNQGTSRTGAHRPWAARSTTRHPQSTRWRRAKRNCRGSIAPDGERATRWERRSRRRDRAPQGRGHRTVTTMPTSAHLQHGSGARRRIAVHSPAPTVPTFRPAVPNGHAQALVVLPRTNDPPVGASLPAARSPSQGAAPALSPPRGHRAPSSRPAALRAAGSRYIAPLPRCRHSGRWASSWCGRQLVPPEDLRS